ncbi:MAG: helix-turn-helix domain-containing protein [Nitrospira sp. CG24E]|nr:MAG: helix-turn-helix domain-containing protein [Nitrospira sp. CG24E]
MKKELLTVKELAAELRMSVKSIQRAYRAGEIPVEWMRRMARFDLAQVRRAMKRTPQIAPFGKTGAVFKVYLTDVLMSAWTCLLGM